MGHYNESWSAWINRTHWKALYVNAENITYFDSLGVEYIPKEIRKFIGNKSFKTNIYRIQAFNSKMCLIEIYFQSTAFWLVQYLY